MLKIGYKLSDFREYRGVTPLYLDLDTHCHTLLTGASGSGKSYALLYILGQVLQSYPDTVIYFCDFKNSLDFSFMADYTHFYGGDNCINGIKEFEVLFEECRTAQQYEKRYLLIVDEYPSMLNYLQGADKRNKTKIADDISGVIARLLMLGRGLHFYVWLTTQRADASLFANGSRDNFLNVIALGRLSKEQKTMIFSGLDVPADQIYGKGEGLILSDGKELKEIKIPMISDLNDWKDHIRATLQGSEGEARRALQS